MKIIAVDGRKFSPDLLREALARAKGGGAPIELLVENAEYYKTVRVEYHDGERSPHLVRDPSKPDVLESIVRPLARK